MTPKIQSRLPNAGTSIFTVMSALATEHNAINLGQGFPDFPMSEALVEKVNEVMKRGFNQYVPMQGYLPLREALAEKIGHLYAQSIDPVSQITVTPGGTYAIYTALTTILQPGDEVILFEPAYDSYIPNVEINGAKAVRIDLEFPSYSINWDKVKKAITPKTRAILINSPHNPTGAVLTAADIEQLRACTAGTSIFIISDEVYEHLIFDGKPHLSMLRYPDLMERSFVCFSFGKTYHCTGWKLGYCIASPAAMAEYRKVHQFNAFCCHTPSQVALAEYLTNREAYLSLPAFMQEKRDYFIAQMQSTRFGLMHSGGSYFICATYDKISDEPDLDFSKRITKEYGVATIPVSAFYKDATDNKVVRFCFAKKQGTIDQAIERLAKVK
jgi:methionine aminotransferase